MICQDCGIDKDGAKFYTLKSGKLSARCRACVGVRNKELRRRKKEGLPNKEEEKRIVALTRTEKQCTTCNELKPLSLFFKKSSSLDGYSCECKDCEATRRRQRYAHNKQLRLIDDRTELMCKVCNRLLPIDDFGVTPSRKRGRQSVCKECNSKQIKQYYSDPYRRVKRMLYAIKRRSDKANIPFNLDVEDIQIPEVCPILGIPLFQTAEHRDNYPSVDRIIPALGYVKGNIIVISYRANRIKNDATIEELGLIASYYATISNEHKRK